MPRGRPENAFSLVEVVIAVGIFAVSIALIVALLPALTRQTADAAELRVAQAMPDLLAAEIRRVAGPSLDSFGGSVPVMSAPLPDGYVFVADRAGARLHSTAVLPPSAQVIPVGERFFRVDAWRFPLAPLAFDASAGTLALYVRISWPYYNPGSSTPTPLEARSQFAFTLALNR